MSKAPHWVRTGDGSMTLRRASGLGYRSRHGACAESQHVFVDGAFGATPERCATDKPMWRVLEVGLGAGTNWSTTRAAARARGVRLDYFAAEYAPPPAAVFTSPDAPPTQRPLARVYAEAKRGTTRTWSAADLDDAPPPASDSAATPPAALTVFFGPLLTWADAPGQMDAVYFDPFGPRDEAGSWSLPTLAFCAERLAPEGRLCTYAAASHVRRGLCAAGLFVGVRPGFGPKRECTVAAWSEAGLGDAVLKYAPAERDDVGRRPAAKGAA